MTDLQNLESLSVVLGALFGAFGSLLVGAIFVGTQWTRWKKFLLAKQSGYFDRRIEDRIKTIEKLLELSSGTDSIGSGLVEKFERALENKIDDNSRIRITTKTEKSAFCLDMAGDMLGGAPYAVWKSGGQRYGRIERVID